MEELFEAVHRRFGTSFGDFSFYDYFLDEGDLCDGRFPRLFGAAPPKKALTVRHLAAVVRRGTWFDP